MIRKLKELVERAAQRGTRRLVVAYAEDAHTLGAVAAAHKAGLVEATLIGNIENIKKTALDAGVNIDPFELVQVDGDSACVTRAVAMVRAGEADVLMKGLVSTDKYMRGILAKDGGLVPPRGTLSHVTVLELPQYHKLLTITDVAVIPAPDINQKVALTRYVIGVAHTLEIDTPKVALVAPTEQMLAGMPSCVDAAIISKMAERGQITGAVVDGPLAIDVALDPETVAIKKLRSAVEGDADCLVFPNIESANVFFKTATKLCCGELAAMVVGASAPCVLTSRGDSEASKLYSIALACMSAGRK